jgi:hypothetical protein
MRQHILERFLILLVADILISHPPVTQRDPSSPRLILTAQPSHHFFELPNSLYILAHQNFGSIKLLFLLTIGSVKLVVSSAEIGS